MTTDGYSVGPTTTEWHDALVKHKIIERQPKPKSQDVIDTQIMWEKKERMEKQNDKLTLEELNVLEDEIEENELERLRKKRIQELQQQQKLNKYGTIKHISKKEYEKEVTNASKDGTLVICCLFAYGQEDSRIILRCLGKLATKFKSIKICKIQGQECIDNYPDKFCPTMVIYKNGDPVGNIKGAKPFGGKGATAEIIEWELFELGLIKSNLESNPRQFKITNIGRGGINKNTNSKHNPYPNKYKNDSENDSEDSLDL